MKTKKRFPGWIIPLIILLAVGGALFNYRAHPIQVQAPAVDLTKVHTTQVVMGSIADSVSTTGAVRTNQTTSLTWGISGQVSQVLVKPGDAVTAGEVLAQLDPASNVTFVTTQASLLTAQEALANLQNTTVAVATAQIALLQAQAALTTAQKAVSDLQLAPTQAQIDAAYAATLQDQKSVYRLQVAFNILAASPVTELDRANALTALNNATAKENQDVGMYNQLKNHQPDAAALATAQSNLALAQQQLAVAQANVTLANAGPDASQVSAAQASIQQIQSSLDQQYLRAPSAGTVTSVSTQVNDLVSPGTAAFQIDDLTSLYMDLPVSETNIMAVQIGQAVALTFNAVPNQDYSAKVTAISASGTVTAGVANYTVTVLLTHADSQVRPGMTAAANIISQQLNNVMLVPNLSITTLNGKRVVYRMAGGQMSPVTVTESLVSDTQTAVVSPDLKVGDAIVVNPASLATAPAVPGFQATLDNLLLKLGVIAYS